ncbi:hypothetical protein LJR153_002804 [Paenibacillus sp. LjRoot153]|uniref:hypothetical protein n=1 Tax=Paenibacillus sp. LjRoot153 TaxID=3342270 RepID=UPI003ECC53B6
MFQRDLTGTKKLLEEALLPVLGSLDGLVLEYEMTSLSGVKIYGDVFHPKIRTVFEEDSFVTHAEKITRDRFSFERARTRSVAILGYTYFPYSRDELERKPSFCQRNLYGLIGRIGNVEGAGLLQLPVYEREVLRFSLLGNKPFRVTDVSTWLQLKSETCRKVLRDLEAKGLVYPTRKNRVTRGDSGNYSSVTPKNRVTHSTPLIHTSHTINVIKHIFTSIVVQ